MLNLTQILTKHENFLDNDTRFKAVRFKLTPQSIRIYPLFSIPKQLNFEFTQTLIKPEI